MPPLQPNRLLLIAIAGWIQGKQAATFAYRIGENRVLRELPGKLTYRDTSRAPSTSKLSTNTPSDRTKDAGTN